MQELRETKADDADALATRFADDGYLLARGLVDVDCVEKLATGVLAIIEELGLQEHSPDVVDRFRATRTT